VGLVKTLIIVALANGITLITTLSFSAIATNIRLGGGGAYYIISRSLGLEFGGAIGLPLFLSQVFSVTLYAFGLAESMRILWPDVPVQPAAFVIVIAVGALAYRGARLALSVQTPILFFIALSLGALVFGVLFGPGVTAVSDLPAPRSDFWVVFAVFFPAVTGIMAGLGLSGDLRDPIKSIPRGAIGATLVGFIVYLLIPFILIKGASFEALRQEPLIWTKIAPLGAILILPGLWGAIFSSAVGSILGAPRTLQAMASDGLVLSFLGRGSKGGSEPIVGLIVSIIIALAAVMLGDLNAVAPVVTMFFLTVYGMVNLVAAVESISGDPSWRPRLHVHWAFCLLGAVGCFAVMFLINAKAAVAAIIIEILLWAFLARRERQAGWGDVRRDIYEALIRWSLVRLSRRPMTARNWRPHVLAFVDSAERHLDLIRFGTWFSQGRGVVTVCELVVGDLIMEKIDFREKEEKISRTLKRERLVAFGEVDIVPDVISGITDVSQANGIAGLNSNTILLGWSRNPEKRVDFLRVVNRLEKLGKSVIIGRIQPGLIPRENEERIIHVWWGGLKHNSDLMLLLAHLITRNPEWRSSQIVILSVASNEHMKANTEHYLESLIPAIRIVAEVQVMIAEKDRTIKEIISEKSAEADIVFLGLDPPENDKDIIKYATYLEEFSEPLRTVFFVKNSSLFVGQLVQTWDEVAAVSPETENKNSAPQNTDPGV
ncbi:MAG: Na-K-Cl cotransporter, partial [Candidatus Eisenbacteria bacterium]|nr:Na-K-Cl cotransporter [Candidatus Eisenbacteria bacterium]